MVLSEQSNPHEEEQAPIVIGLGPGLWEEFRDIEALGRTGEVSPVDQMISRHTLNAIRLGPYFTVDKKGIKLKAGYSSFRTEEIPSREGSAESTEGIITLIKSPKQECPARVVRSAIARVSLPPGVMPGDNISFLEAACSEKCPRNGELFIGTGNTPKKAEKNALSTLANSSITCSSTGERIGSRLASQGVVLNPGSRSENL